MKDELMRLADLYAGAAMATVQGGDEDDELKARAALLAEIERLAAPAEPVATLHDDGCFTWKSDKYRLLYDRERAGWRMDVYAHPAPQTAQSAGDVVVTRDEAGNIVAVTRQDEEGRILSVIAEAQPADAQDAALGGGND